MCPCFFFVYIYINTYKIKGDLYHDIHDVKQVLVGVPNRQIRWMPIECVLLNEQLVVFLNEHHYFCSRSRRKPYDGFMDDEANSLVTIQLRFRSFHNSKLLHYDEMNGTSSREKTDEPCVRVMKSL